MQSIWFGNSKKSILANAVFLTNNPPGTDQQVSAISKIMLLVIGVAILSISAHVKVPFYPVPMTLQTLVVLLIGMSYGSRLGGATILSYLLLGALGAPVFSGGTGFACLIGPTGGYLLGFFVSTVLLGFLAERGMGKTWKTSALLAVIGTIIIYMLGLVWLTSIIGHEKAIQFGLLPFIYGDLLKLVLVSISVPLAWKLVQKITHK
jgi:biotin transport system substrate-specific component